jgi:hypothetical protein
MTTRQLPLEARWEELRQAIGTMVDRKAGHSCDEVIHPACWRRVELAYRALTGVAAPGDRAMSVTVWVAWYEEGDAGALPGQPRRVRSNYKPVHEVYVVPPKKLEEPAE